MSNTIVIGQNAIVVVTLLSDGIAFPINSGSTVTAQLFDIATLAELFTPAITSNYSDAGSNWPAGVVSIAFNSTQTANLTAPAAMLVVMVNGRPFRFRIDVNASSAGYDSSALFVRDFVIADIRQDSLLMLAQTIYPNITPSDDFIWNKVLAAESEIAHTLRVELQPTAFFPKPPTSDQLAGIGTMPWKIDSAYDYDPAMFQGDNWSFIQLRNKPMISLTSVNYNYPSENDFDYNIPLEWLKFDAKFGQVRIVPTSNITLAMLGGFMIQLIGAGRVIPHILNITYVAGLVDPGKDFPELLDAVKKLAVLKMIEEAFLPQSGSISADGLSQSMSVDISKYRDMINNILNGPPGSNGGLETAIHGVRFLVF